METIPDGLDAARARAVLLRLGLCTPDEPLACEPLAGGVSSDIVRVDLPGRSVCVKRALGRLKVAADWRVPVERSAHEAEWLRVAGGIVPHAVPRCLGYDPVLGALAMPWLAPDRHPVWKGLLRDGHCDPAFAAAVADAFAAIGGICWRDRRGISRAARALMTSSNGSRSLRAKRGTCAIGMRQCPSQWILARRGQSADMDGPRLCGEGN